MNEFDSTLAKANLWLRDVGEELSCESRAALRALRVVLHALRDRLPVNEATDLGAQMPMLIRGLYYEGWRATGKPERMNREQFIDRVRSELDPRLAPRAEDAVRAVLSVLTRHISPGELEDVEHVLPRAMRDLWLI